jgi:1-deoxy-D-xylulose-5-phosphate synthase
MLRCIPGIKLLAPANASELKAMMQQAVHADYPIAIRYPKGPIPDFYPDFNSTDILNHQEICLKKGEKVAVISTGNATNLARKAFGLANTMAAHYHFPVIHPFTAAISKDLTNNFSHIITVEDGAVAGGFGESVAQNLFANGFAGTIQNLGIPDYFIPHGSNEILYDLCGYSPEKIAKTVNDALNQP